jgi:hypothetical protein
MRSTEIQRLVDEVESRYGAVTLYGSDPSEEYGTCFFIAGLPATFSVHTQNGELPPGDYDIQIEGIPPGDYIFSSVAYPSVHSWSWSKECGGLRNNGLG